MELITAPEVISRIEWYYEGGILRSLSALERRAAERGIRATRHNGFDRAPVNLHNAGSACDRFLTQIPAYPGGFEGRGIVICAGGVRYFTAGWVCIRMLRRLGCRVPIELWYRGEKELDARMRALVAPFGVECIDATEVRRKCPVRMWHRWALKPYAILRSRFREVLCLDADNVPVANPEFLFGSKPFRDLGAIFWPDYHRCGGKKARPVWRSCGLRQPREQEFETGQMVVDKERCWKALCLSLWFNENSDFYYQHLHGDKETFHLAFRKLGQADYILFLEDDLEFNRHLRHNLYAWRPFRERTAILGSLYNPGLSELACDQSQRTRMVPPSSVFGSQAFLISNESLKYIIANWDRVRGLQDIRISRLAGRLGSPILYHAPSLVQHVGRISTSDGYCHQAGDYDPDWKAD